jgi:hypothetical protein
MRREDKAFAATVAEMLGERHPATRFQLELIVKTLGREQVKALLKETLTIENGGGQLLPNGSRKRTIGGVFFNLVKSRFAKILPREVLMYHTFIKLKRKPLRPVGKRQPNRPTRIAS